MITHARDMQIPTMIATPIRASKNSRVCGDGSRTLIFSLCALSIAVVGLIDYLTGAQVSVAVVYLLPIALGTWAFSRGVGFLLAFACVFVWFVVERLEATPYSHPLIQAWNAFALLVTFCVVVLLLSKLSRSYDWLESEVEKRTSELRQAVADLRESHAALKNAQLRLIQAAKMESVGILAAGIAHEVKNPLTTILMGLDYLESLPIAKVEAVAVLKDQRDAVLRATAIINELLDFSAPSELHPCPENLNDVVERALGFVKHELAKGRIAVARELQPQLPALMLDRNKMEQVFVNVFTNAVHAMEGGGTLTIRTIGAPANAGAQASAGKRSRIAVIVDDTGPGFPESDLARVFDPFFTTKSPRKGTGLGLSIVRQIVQMHGGSVEVSNRTEGGARFAATFYTEEECHS